MIPRVLIVATWCLVAWGALAFGAVYPWAWRPLITGCAVIGVAAAIVAWRHGGRAHDQALLAALGCVALAALVQLTPLSRDARLAISPGNEAVLVEQDLEYASVIRMSGVAPDGTGLAVPDIVDSRPLSIAPTATARALVLLVGFTLLLAGLTRLLHVTGARRFCTGLVAIGVLLAIIGVVQKATLGDHAALGMRIYGFWAPHNQLTTPFGPFVNKNHFAGWMLMALPVALGLGLGWAERASRRMGPGWRSAMSWMSSPDVGKLQVAVLATLLMGVSLALTTSRSGIVGFLIAATLGVVAVGRRFGSGRARLGAVAGLVLLVVAMFAWSGADVGARFSAGAGAIDLRRHIWSDSGRVVRDFPLVGTGLNTFGQAMLSYQSRLRATQFQEAHNDYLQILVEGGVLIAVPAAVAILLLARAIRYRFRLQQDDAMTYWLRVGATIGLVAVGLQSMVEFSLQMPGNATLCVTLMAVAIHETPRRYTRRHNGGTSNTSKA